MSLATLAASQLWSSASAVARALARAGLTPRRQLPSRVVSVGNLQAGGSGKTPLVARIARDGLARGLSVAILMRGYGGAWERDGGLISPTGPAPRADECGDEAALLRELAPGAWVGVGADRGASFDRVVAAAGGRAPDLVILDDGFQHHAIARDVDVVALTSEDAASMIHRDWPTALAAASLVVWTKGDRRPDPRGRPMACARFKLAALNGAQPLWLVTGVARPEAVAAAVREAGGRLAGHVALADHARYDRETVAGYLAAARAAGAELATTGKDWVKWRDLGIARADVRVLEPETTITEGAELWEETVWGA